MRKEERGTNGGMRGEGRGGGSEESEGGMDRRKEWKEGDLSDIHCRKLGELRVVKWGANEKE